MRGFGGVLGSRKAAEHFFNNLYAGLTHLGMAVETVVCERVSGSEIPTNREKSLILGLI